MSIFTTFGAISIVGKKLGGGARSKYGLSVEYMALITSDFARTSGGPLAGIKALVVDFAPIGLFCALAVAWGLSANPPVKDGGDGRWSASNRPDHLGL